METGLNIAIRLNAYESHPVLGIYINMAAAYVLLKRKKEALDAVEEAEDLASKILVDPNPPELSRIGLLRSDIARLR